MKLLYLNVSKINYKYFMNILMGGTIPKFLLECEEKKMGGTIVRFTAYGIKKLEKF